MKNIKAIHPDGRTATFTQKSWDKLGKNKDGWVLANPEPPEEVKDALTNANPEPPEEVKDAPKKGGKK